MTTTLAEAIGSFADNCLPPEQDYSSRGALFESINAWAATQGYAFTTGRSHKEKSGRLTVTFVCDRSCRPPPASKERQRRTTTRGNGCQFSVLAKESMDKNTWSLRHRPDQRFSSHNHPPSQHPSAHPAHRKMSEEDLVQLSNLSNAGIAPRDIRTYIRQTSNSMATQQDIYNRIAAAKRETSEGQSSIHALANQLDNEGFWSRMQFAPDGRVTAVLFAHPDSLALLQAYPDVLLLDCTYKTNKYGMPLLDMIGIDACQRSFCIAFAFLSGESEEDYVWALDRLKSLYDQCSAKPPAVVLTDRCIACINAVERIFPSSASLLCLWHANKAVLRQCFSAFTTLRPTAVSSTATPRDSSMEKWKEFYEFWHSIMRSPTDDAFMKRVEEFQRRYVANHLEEVGYVMTYWLDPWKERLVKAWVDQHTHFGNVATSRVEGIHALLKSHLKRSTLDLFDAWRAMKHALLNQLSELRFNQAKQQTRTPIELSGPLYGTVRGWISHEALRKVEEQRRLLLKDDPPPSLTCTGTFTRVHGLPCLHQLKTLQEQDRVLLLEHFHSHWHLRRDGAPQILLEPRQRIEPAELRPQSSTVPTSSTRRMPSQFEAAEPATRAPSTCSRCRGVGHTMSSKACPQRHSHLLPKEACPPVLVLQPTANMTANSRPVGKIAGLSSNLEQTAPGLVPHAAVVTPLVTSEARPQASPVPSPRHSASPPRYDSPQAIYGRYIAARSAWYDAQPRGSIKTNQEYRREMGLPQRYDKKSYEWCLDYKQMTKRCTAPSGSREWTKEEMMAYLDWNRAEQERVDQLVAVEAGENPFRNKRRGMGDIWRRVEKDIEEQTAVYSAEGRVGECIVVGS